MAFIINKFPLVILQLRTLPHSISLLLSLSLNKQKIAMKSIFFFIFLLFTSSPAKAQSEVHISLGVERSFVSPYNSFINSAGTKAGRRFQFSYQHVFKHVGFMLSYENVKRQLVLNNKKIIREISVVNGQYNSNRIMIYCVGRIRANPKLIFDARFGLGKLIKSPNKYNTNNIYSQAFMNFIPGLSLSWALKTQYKFSNYIGTFIEASYTLTPYTYSSITKIFWIPMTQYKSGYLSNLSLSIGLAFSFKK